MTYLDIFVLVMASLLTLAIIILICISAYFEKKQQYDKQQENEYRKESYLNILQNLENRISDLERNK